MTTQNFLKLLTTAGLTFVLLFFPALGVLATGAEGNPVGGGAITIDNPLKDDIDTLPELVSIIVGAVVQVGVPVVALGIIYSGFLFVTARGKPEEINKAKDAFLWTVIGAMIVLGAFVVVEVIQGTINQLK